MNHGRDAVRRLALAVVTAMAGALAALPATAAEAGHPSPAPIAWGECPADVAATAQQLQCGSVSVPLDYDEPDGTQIEIVVSRLASSAPSERRGVLMLNPGGPGGSGLSMPAELVSQGLPASVTNGYDVIGMDTRGIGHSAPISCGFTDDQDYRGAIPPYAVDSAAVVERAEAAKGVAEQCAENDTHGRLRHVSTANMARDLDRIRVALGEEKISYLGYSYGTALGAAYASMFPDHSDRIVLDSNIGDTHLDRDGMRRYGLGAEETFPHFARWAAARHDSYGLGRSPAEVRRTYFELAERLDEHPVAGLDGAYFRLGVFVSLYKESLYPQMAQQWQALLSSDEAAAQSQLERAGGPDTAAEPSGPGGLSPHDNTWSVFLAVTCNDVEWAEDVETYQRAVAEDRQRYPVFGAAAANILPCAFWSHEPDELPVAIDDDGPHNVLILQNRHDPVTPHRGGQLLREKFEQRSRLVSVEASGHGAYVHDDNPCATNVVTRFLVEGTMPSRDTRCRA